MLAALAVSTMMVVLTSRCSAARITYGAIGSSAAAMAERWRLVFAIEGVNGIILIGWSTAFFVTLIARMRRT